MFLLQAAVDHEAVGLALEEDLYRTANPQGIGFRVYGKAHDDTTVSADSPSWFQLPGVTVNKLSAIQLGSLVQWKAPIPMKHTDGELLTNFFGVRRTRTDVSSPGTRREVKRLDRLAALVWFTTMKLC